MENKEKKQIMNEIINEAYIELYDFRYGFLDKDTIARIRNTNDDFKLILWALVYESIEWKYSTDNNALAEYRAWFISWLKKQIDKIK